MLLCCKQTLCDFQVPADYLPLPLSVRRDRFQSLPPAGAVLATSCRSPARLLELRLPELCHHATKKKREHHIRLRVFLKA